MRRSYISGHNNNRHLASEELENNIGGLPVTEPKIRELFDSLDINRNGVLEFNEVKKLYQSFDNFGIEYTDAEIENHLRKVAKSTDNTVSFDEFSCIILNLAQR
ncbi:Ca2+-binding protein, putative [Bodo saltans]|uniref:Ca2+-binding protein, putative n=1 Tax=Bodo saltans TaxID=75058 RepID=A0A0S4J6C4_BODSA|nr:Ca2+-binding protein, putative [Bodo saltans]CUG86012.1 Ca2+-binding protein, putative [Bodo saltans]|eukprot:CUG86011.1 Ca2+-binding protein, putative [Bodo saltans]